MSPQTPNDPEWKIVHRIADSVVESTARALNAEWKRQRKDFNVQDATNAIRAGQDPLAPDYGVEALTEAMVETLGEVARMTALALLPTLAKEAHQSFAEPDVDRKYQLELELRFMAAEEFIHDYLPVLIVDIDKTTRQAIREIVLEGFKVGNHPYVMAEQIRDLIGLTPGQVRAYRAFAANLAKGIQSQNGQGSLIERYLERARLHRARNIARTETIRAANAGQLKLWQKARTNGLLGPSAMRKWIITPDDRLCRYCQQLLNAVTSIDGVWRVGKFDVRQPPFHPSCRCAMGLVFP